MFYDIVKRCEREWRLVHDTLCSDRLYVELNVGGERVEAHDTLCSDRLYVELLVEREWRLVHDTLWYMTDYMLNFIDIKGALFMIV